MMSQRVWHQPSDRDDTQDAPFEFKGSGYRTDIAIFEPWRSKHMKKNPDRLLA